MTVRGDGPVDGRVVGVGIDLVDVARLRAALERTPALAARLFTPAERADRERGDDPVRPLAVCFAVKESVMKALGCGFATVGFDEIDVTVAAAGTSVRLTGRAAARAAAQGVATWSVAVDGDGPVVRATAVATAP